MIGIGLYTVAEAARLTVIPPISIRRWLFGYHFRHGGRAGTMPPLWASQVSAGTGALGLGFRDMIELRFVAAFRAKGVGLPAIRAALETARRLYRRDHPLSSQRFRTDGRRIFAEELEPSGEVSTTDLTTAQQVFHAVVERTLSPGLEFGNDGAVRCWFPDGAARRIVIDPLRSFGRPIVVEGGVPTETLAAAAKAEGSVARAARLYDVSKASVRAAVAFESRLAA